MVRKIIPPIHIHPVLIFFVAISLLTGTFTEMAIIFLIVFIHEMGHYAMARYFGWRIRRVMLWVFGGVMETEEHGNRPIKEEMWVTLAGPLQHLFIYAILFISLSLGWIPEVIFQKALSYNTIILLFNLLPIWPLDGGKILFLYLNILYPFKQALTIIYLFSLSLCVVFGVGYLLFYPFTLTFTLIMVFLFLENRLEWKRRMYVFMRFLMERYRGKHSIQKVEPLYLTGDLTLMEVFQQFKRGKRHTVIISTDSIPLRIDETDFLHAYFYHKQYASRIEELF